MAEVTNLNLLQNGSPVECQEFESSEQTTELDVLIYGVSGEAGLE